MSNEAPVALSGEPPKSTHLLRDISIFFLFIVVGYSKKTPCTCTAKGIPEILPTLFFFSFFSCLQSAAAPRAVDRTSRQRALTATASPPPPCVGALFFLSNLLIIFKRWCRCAMQCNAHGPICGLWWWWWRCPRAQKGNVVFFSWCDLLT